MGLQVSPSRIWETNEPWGQPPPSGSALPVHPLASPLLEPELLPVPVVDWADVELDAEAAVLLEPPIEAVEELEPLEVPLVARDVRDVEPPLVELCAQLAPTQPSVEPATVVPGEVDRHPARERRRTT
jgi:hypothetical protein